MTTCDLPGIINTTLYLQLLLLLLSCLYSPMWAFASLMDLIQSSLFFDLCYQFLILHFLISPYTQSHHLNLGLPLGRLPWGWYFHLINPFPWDWSVPFDPIIPRPHVCVPNIVNFTGWGPGGPGLRIYNPRKQGDPVIPTLQLLLQISRQDLRSL
jgi:hypothetical protein